MHGWGGSLDSFLGIAKQMSAKYRVTLVDFFGFGATPHPDKALTLSDFTEAVYEIIKYYKMSSVSFVAHSFGGRVALLFAVKYPHIVDGMILTDVAGMKPRRKPSYYFKIWTFKLKRKLGFKATGGSDDYRALSGAMKGTFKNIVSEHLDKKVNGLTVPTILIWGTKDNETPLYMAKRLKRKLKNSALVTLFGDHFCYLTRSTGFVKIAESFLEGIYE